MPIHREVTQQELERLWSARLTHVRGKYEAAAAKSLALSREMQQSVDSSPDAAHALRTAHREEAAALYEYLRVLSSVTGLVLGHVPEDEDLREIR